MEDFFSQFTEQILESHLWPREWNHSDIFIDISSLVNIDCHLNRHVHVLGQDSVSHQ